MTAQNQEHFDAGYDLGFSEGHMPVYTMEIECITPEVVKYIRLEIQEVIVKRNQVVFRGFIGPTSEEITPIRCLVRADGEIVVSQPMRSQPTKAPWAEMEVEQVVNVRSPPPLSFLPLEFAWLNHPWFAGENPYFAGE